MSSQLQKRTKLVSYPNKNSLEHVPEAIAVQFIFSITAAGKTTRIVITFLSAGIQRGVTFVNIFTSVALEFVSTLTSQWRRCSWCLSRWRRTDSRG